MSEPAKVVTVVETVPAPTQSPKPAPESSQAAPESSMPEPAAPQDPSSSPKPAPAAAMDPPQSPKPVAAAPPEIAPSPKPAPAESQGPPPPSASYPPLPPSPTPGSPDIVYVENPEQIKTAPALPPPAAPAAPVPAAPVPATPMPAILAPAAPSLVASIPAAPVPAAPIPATPAPAAPILNVQAEIAKVERETAEKVALAKAEKEKAEKEAADKAIAEKLTKEVAEKEKAAKDKAEIEAAEHAAKETAEKAKLEALKVAAVVAKPASESTSVPRPVEIVVEKLPKPTETIEKPAPVKAPIEIVIEKPSPAKPVEIIEKPLAKPTEVVIDALKSTRPVQGPMPQAKALKAVQVIVEHSETKCPAACKCMPYCKCTVCRCHEHKPKGHELSEQIRQVVIVEPPAERKLKFLHKLKSRYYTITQEQRKRKSNVDKARKRDRFRNRVLGLSSLSFLIGRHHATVIQPSMEASAAAKKAEMTSEELAGLDQTDLKSRNSCSDFRRSIVTKMHDRRGDWHKRQADLHSNFAANAERNAWDEGVRHHVQRAELHARKQLKHAERHLRGRKRYTFQEDHAAERHLNRREHQRGRWMDMEDRHRDASRNYEDKRRDGERYLREARQRLEERLDSDKQKLEAKGARFRQHLSRPHVPPRAESVEASRLDMDYTRPRTEENVIYTQLRDGVSTLQNTSKGAARELRRDVRAAEAEAASSVKAVVLAAKEMRERRLSQKEPVEFDVIRCPTGDHFGARLDGSSISTPMPGNGGQHPLATKESLEWDGRAGGPSIRARHKLFWRPSKEMVSISETSSSDASTKSVWNGKTKSRQQSLRQLSPQRDERYEPDQNTYLKIQPPWVKRAHISSSLMTHLNAKVALKRMTSKASLPAVFEHPRSPSPSLWHPRSPPPKPFRWRRLMNRARRMKKQHGPNKALYQSPVIRQKKERTFSIGSKDGSTERCRSVSFPPLSCTPSLSAEDIVSILKV